MHNYPLHRVTAAECTCCRIERDFTFVSKYDHVLCPACIQHQGDTAEKANQRDFDHVNLWHSEMAIIKEDHANAWAEFRERTKQAIDQRDKKIADLSAEIEDLRSVVRGNLENAPWPTVQHWFEGEQVTEALGKRDSAYRSRDHAFQALWAIDQDHLEDDNRAGYCACGERTAQCTTFSNLERVRGALYRWESHQIDRLQSDLEHGLPNQHPEVQRRNGQWHRRRRAS